MIDTNLEVIVEIITEKLHNNKKYVWVLENKTGCYKITIKNMSLRSIKKITNSKYKNLIKDENILTESDFKILAGDSFENTNKGENS